MSASAESASANAAGSTDPTGTKSLREREFTGAFNGRWRDVRGAFRDTIERNDAFRLTDRSRPPGSGATLAELERATGAVSDFGATEDGARQVRWRAWSTSVLAATVLEPLSTAEIRNGQHYTAEYLNRAYTRGLVLADRDAKQASLDGAADLDGVGDVIGRDRHQDVLAAARTRVYDDVETAVTETRTQAGRRIAEGLAAGVALRTLADSAIDRVEHVGQYRTTATAHYRTVEAVNAAILTRAEEIGATEVGLAPEIPETDGGSDPHTEFQTAGDSNVCEDCAPLGGETWTLAEIRQGRAIRPPLHPYCRCRWTIIA